MNEFQAAFQHSQATHLDRFPHSPLFTTLLQSGFSVVLHSWSQYCRITDARLPGNNQAVIAAFATREAAIDYWMQHQEQFELSDYDESYTLLHPQNLDRYDDALALPIVGTVCDTTGQPIPNLRLPTHIALEQAEPSNSDEISF
jgi:hypothetical protein